MEWVAVAMECVHIAGVGLYWPVEDTDDEDDCCSAPAGSRPPLVVAGAELKCGGGVENEGEDPPKTNGILWDGKQLGLKANML